MNKLMNESAREAEIGDAEDDDLEDGDAGGEVTIVEETQPEELEAAVIKARKQARRVV